MKPRVRTTRSEPQAVRAAWSIALPVAITLLGFGLRLYRIDHQSIWWDEAYSIFIARGGLRAVWGLPYTISYNHPPLHYALLIGGCARRGE